MLNTYTIAGETWVDIDQGTEEEIAELATRHEIHPFVMKEIATASPKARLDTGDKYIYCILHFPVYKHTHAGDAKSQEIDFIIGKETLITARYDTVDALHKFAKDLEVTEVLQNTEVIEVTPRIFPRLMQSLYASLLEELAYIEDQTQAITDNVFKGKEKEMVVSISHITQTLLDFKKVTDAHEEILQSLKAAGLQTFGEDFARDIDGVIEKYTRINTAITNNLATLSELRQTNNSMLTAKQNETIKKLTIIGAILFILSILITLYH